MNAINKVVLRGHLGKDPQCRALPNGIAACRLVLATTVTERDQLSGKVVQATEWHHAVLEGQLAETASTELAKGDEVQIEGQLKTRKWTDRRGVLRYLTEVRAESIHLFRKPVVADTPLTADSLDWVAAYDAAWTIERAVANERESSRLARAASSPGK